jgi:drug/metabolite transporter (DMT)-like permease
MKAIRATRTVHVASWLQIVMVVGLTLIYGVCYATIKAGLAFAPPSRFAGLRALLGGVALLSLAWATGSRSFPERRRWPWILALGLLVTTVSFAGMFLSPGRTTTGVASVLGNTQPLMLVVLAALFLREAVTARKLLALGLGLAGVAALSYPAWSGPQAYGLSGPLLALAASDGAAAGSVIVKRMAPGRDLLAVSAWQLILGSLPLWLASAVVEPRATIEWRAQFTAILFFLALIGTALASAAWYWLIQHEDVGAVVPLPIPGAVVRPGHRRAAVARAGQHVRRHRRHIGRQWDCHRDENGLKRPPLPKTQRRELHRPPFRRRLHVLTARPCPDNATT